jgi:hypothetical protein
VAITSLSDMRGKGFWHGGRNVGGGSRGWPQRGRYAPIFVAVVCEGVRSHSSGAMANARQEIVEVRNVRGTKPARWEWFRLPCSNQLSILRRPPDSATRSIPSIHSKLI